MRPISKDLWIRGTRWHLVPGLRRVSRTAGRLGDGTGKFTIPVKGKDYEGMPADYYEARVWDPETGTPTGNKLRVLGRPE